jgi:glycerate kinase
VDALGRPCTARYARNDGGTVIVELAQASGLPRVADRLDARHASTLGTGQVIAAALAAAPVREVLLTLGGSASTDGGAGILKALGARLLDAEDREIDDGGGALARLDRIDMSGVMSAARAARWLLAVDVTNPLTGMRGAAAVFGPQKGAGKDDVVDLDGALAHWARVLARDVGPVDPMAGGMGAAGGTPTGLVAAFGAEVVSGARLVADAIGLPGYLAGADLVITGEGSFDVSSFSGKAVGTVVELARVAGVPVAVLAGAVRVDRDRLRRAGIAGARSIADGPRTLASLAAHAPALIEAAAADTVTLFVAGGRGF